MIAELDQKALQHRSFKVNPLRSFREVWPSLVVRYGGQESDLYHVVKSALLELLNRPWFKRVWILQEVANARIATVICGSHSVPARAFAITPDLFGIEVPTHIQAVLDLIPGPVRKETWYMGDRTLATLLGKFGYSLASFEHDRVYALLGICSDAPGTFPARYDWSMDWLVHNTLSFVLFGEMLPETGASQVWMRQLPPFSMDELVKITQLRRHFKVCFLVWAILASRYALVARLLEKEAFDSNQTEQTTAAFALLARNIDTDKNQEDGLRRILAQLDHISGRRNGEGSVPLADVARALITHRFHKAIPGLLAVPACEPFTTQLKNWLFLNLPHAQLQYNSQFGEDYTALFDAVRPRRKRLLRFRRRVLGGDELKRRWTRLLSRICRQEQDNAPQEMTEVVQVEPRARHQPWRWRWNCVYDRKVDPSWSTWAITELISMIEPRQENRLEPELNKLQLAAAQLASTTYVRSLMSESPQREDEFPDDIFIENTY
ncbi:HET-domain-containing protein [Apiospora marii]|uniref:HET-domain-containing protein n=1 Tax=Apiospora marii TaxID=335849 RepID=A0ABR1R4A0_9PEZI